MGMILAKRDLNISTTIKSWLITVVLLFFSCKLLCLYSILQDEKYWPLMPPLPSYGYGREHPGPRYGSLIHGQNLKDVVITGQI